MDELNIQDRYGENDGFEYRKAVKDKTFIEGLHGINSTNQDQQFYHKYVKEIKLENER